MVPPFPYTARILGGGGAPARLLLLVSIAILAAWTTWFVRARVPIYETSEETRLEVLHATYPVDAPVAGRVVAMNLQLNGTVAAGDVLLELDARTERLQLAEAQAKLAGINLEIDATAKQVEAENEALAAFQRQLGAQLEEAQSKVREAEVVTRAAVVTENRTHRLFAERLVSEGELDRARAEAERCKEAESGTRAALGRLRSESSTGEADRQSRISTLKKDAARLESERRSVTANIQTLEHDIELRTIRALTPGRVGEIGNVRVGSVLARGDRIATIVADGNLRVIASFAPSRALGRIHAGQRARIRLDGFPWTEYGAIEATVSQVATELRDGRVRIELAVDPKTPAGIPLQHGLPGSVEVKVDDVTPAQLVIRTTARFGSEASAPASSQ